VRATKETLVTQPHSEETDQALVEALRNGSPDALTALFDRYADSVYTYCFRRTASWSTAEDASATVFLEIWRGRSRVITSADGSALPWLYGVANNVCRNATRSSHRWARALSRVPPAPSEHDHADSVAGRLDSERQMASVLAAIADLPRPEQDVLALVVWSGLSYDAAATALGVPIGTVRSRLSRARRHLATAVDVPASSDPAERDDHV
jgi:RNA polymerase sigma-70 factor (ECF subfamily)